MLENMKKNKTYSYLTGSSSQKEKSEILTTLKDNYLNYRNKWRANPKKAINNKIDWKKI